MDFAHFAMEAFETCEVRVSLSRFMDVILTTSTPADEVRTLALASASSLT